MELQIREKDDVYLPDGSFTGILERLRRCHDAHDLRIGIVNAFDYRTRMLPYWYADRRMAPCSVRTLGDALHAGGFKNIRIVLQQWTPNFRPSEALLDGQPLDLLLVSAMQVHAEPSWDLIRDAHRLGANRPLILAGGPKAIYEPTDYFELGPTPGVGADCVVTGEVFVLLHFLETILRFRRPGETLRPAFARALEYKALNDVPGLAYLAPDSTPENPKAISTGIQRLLRDLDEMPIPDACYRMLERPHRGTRLKPAPLPANKVWRYSPICSVITTHGCKFNCSYCPIPAVNQRTWRHKSPQRVVEEIRHLHEAFGLRTFFSTDDNFFNSRETVVDIFSAMAAATTSRGVPLGKRIRFYTEATQFDVHKNSDILQLCRNGGLRGIWFGIEDITAELVNKGQNPGKTAQMFTMLHKIGIMPMAMMIHSDDQPLRSKPGDLTGLLNQAKYLFKTGAISYQCTYLGPAVGTRDFETAFESGTLYRSIGGETIPQAFFDGNHIVGSRHPRPWDRQLNILWAYMTFYNPINTIRSMYRMMRGRGSVAPKQFAFQIIGQLGLLFTIPKLAGWAWKLAFKPIDVYRRMERARIPLYAVGQDEEIDWAIKHVPTPRPALRAAATRHEEVPAGSRLSLALPVIGA